MTVRACQADWADYTGLVRSLRLYGTNPCTVLNALQGYSNAAVLRNFDANVDPQIGVASAALFQSVADVVSFIFNTAGGNKIELLLPAPQGGIFMADGTTVDLSLVGTLVTAAIGNLTDVGGDVAISLLNGKLRAVNAYGLTPIG